METVFLSYYPAYLQTILVPWLLLADVIVRHAREHESLIDQTGTGTIVCTVRATVLFFLRTLEREEVNEAFSGNMTNLKVVGHERMPSSRTRWTLVAMIMLRIHTSAWREETGRVLQSSCRESRDGADFHLAFICHSTNLDRDGPESLEACVGQVPLSFCCPWPEAFDGIGDGYSPLGNDFHCLTNSTSPYIDGGELFRSNGGGMRASIVDANSSNSPILLHVYAPPMPQAAQCEECDFGCIGD